MNYSNKYLSLTIIFSTAIALTGCLANPNYQNNQNGFNQGGYNNYQNNSILSNYGLMKGNSMHYAEKHLHSQGFSLVNGSEYNGTKLYAKGNECLQLVSSNKDLENVVIRNVNDCYPTRQNSGSNNNQNYNQNSGHNNGAQPAFGQTPVALKDFVDAKAGQAEGDLVRRGYVLRKSAGTNSFWEETASGGCVSIVTDDGRYQSLVYTAPDACR